MADEHAITILLLTEEDCAFCAQAQEVIDRLGSEYPLEVTTQDLSSTLARDLAESAGVLFAPGVFVDGRAFSHGRISERKLRLELERCLSAA